MERLLLIVFVLLFTVSPAFAQSSNDIPEWVKGVADFWVQGSIPDSEFVAAMEFLIDNGIINLPNYEKIVAEPEPVSIVTNSTLTVNSLEIYEDGESQVVESITVTTDKTSYTSGENITVSGLIGTLEEYAQSVTIVVVDPTDNIAAISQVMPESDGSFSHVVSSNAITIEGEYEVRVQYGSLKITSNFDKV